MFSTEPAPQPARLTLPGRYVTLCPLDAEEHGDALWEGAGHPRHEERWLYMGDGPFADREAFNAHLKRKQASEDPLFYTIVDNGTGQALGYAALMRIDPPNRVIEVGHIMYTTALERTRGATEAMYLLARYVFEDLGYRRYEWKCNVLNAPSRAAAQRLGFQYEGLFRQHMIVKGRSRDTAWFAMLDSEWPERKAAFERWLDPANFDDAGRQRSRLDR